MQAGWEPGSGNGGSEGGTKDRKGREKCRLSSVRTMEAGIKKQGGYGQCCGANWVTSTKGAEWEERKDGYESKHWYLWTF